LFDGMAVPVSLVLPVMVLAVSLNSPHLLLTFRTGRIPFETGKDWAIVLLLFDEKFFFCF